MFKFFRRIHFSGRVGGCFAELGINAQHINKDMVIRYANVGFAEGLTPETVATHIVGSYMDAFYPVGREVEREHAIQQIRQWELEGKVPVCYFDQTVIRANSWYESFQQSQTK